MPESNTNKNQYLINIHKWRSLTALLACAVTLGASCFALAASIVNYERSDWDLSHLFRYFTTLSNMLTALASSFIMPFAINGIRKKRFVLPKWLSMLYYSGTSCLTLVFVFAMTFIMAYSKEEAIGDNSFYLHVICPIAVFISYQLVESTYKYSWKETLICLIPFFLYSIIYLFMVEFVGAENGGWNDMYMLVTIVPAYVSFPAMWLLAYAVAFLIRRLSELIHRTRETRMIAAWNKDAEPVEINIEVYGLGRYYGLHGDKDNLSVPFDILEKLANHYGMNLESLYKVYSKGLLDGVCEKEERLV